jgi:hypothetical protein
MSKIISFFSNLFKTSERDKIREQILVEEIDFGNVVSSSLLAKSLYDELKKVCHPDRFLNEQDVIKANEIFQLVTQNKGDYNKLLSLKERIYRELPINRYK